MTVLRLKFGHVVVLIILDPFAVEATVRTVFPIALYFRLEAFLLL